MSPFEAHTCISLQSVVPNETFVPIIFPITSGIPAVRLSFHPSQYPSQAKSILNFPSLDLQDAQSLLRSIAYTSTKLGVHRK